LPLAITAELVAVRSAITWVPVVRAVKCGPLTVAKFVRLPAATRGSGKGIYKMAEKTPSKADLSKAGRDLQNPRTSEKRETEAAKTLQKGAKKK